MLARKSILNLNELTWQLKNKHMLAITSDTCSKIAIFIYMNFWEALKAHTVQTVIPYSAN